MENIRMNADRAKQIGAIAHKDLGTKCSPGDVMIDVSNGRTFRLPIDKKKFNEFVSKYTFKGTYYMRASDMKDVSVLRLEGALHVEESIDDLEEQLEKLKDKQYKIRTDMQKVSTAGASDILVVYYHRKKDDPSRMNNVQGRKIRKDEMVTVEEVKKDLRKGDKLLSLGRRYNNQGSLWIALVEIQGLISDSVQSHYNSIRLFDPANYSTACRLAQTGYKPGDKFGDGIGYIIFNHGKKLKEPLDLDAIRDKERRKEEIAFKKAEKIKWDNVKTTEDKPTRTKIFLYKGVFGIESSAKSEGIIARPVNGNLGVVVNTAGCDITPEAKKVLENASREGGSFAPFMLTKHSGPGTEHGKSSFGWLGGYMQACSPNEVQLGRDCSKEVLADMVTMDVNDMMLPKSFVEYVNKKQVKTQTK